MGLIGIDEVGRGAWSGPVVACSILLKKDFEKHKYYQQIADSKKISKKVRFFLSGLLKQNSVYNFGKSDSIEIDKLGILKATELAMRRSFRPFEELEDQVRIDGEEFFWLNSNTKFVIKGDEKLKVISAASILAKVFRDQLMERLSFKYPFYGWEKNCGYGTKQHKMALEKYGITSQHRKTFKPVKLITNNLNR